MIIEYNRDPSATPEQRIQSLKDNVQLAFNEQQKLSDNLYKTLLKAFGVDVSKLRSDFTSFAEFTQEAITQLGEVVGAAEQDLTDLKARMETVEGKVTSLEGRMSTAEGDISNLKNRVSTLESNYVALEARVRALEGN